MSRPAYFDKYENLAFSRDDGVLTLRFHTDGGPIVFTGQTHEDLPAALDGIALDQESQALVITGTGDSFIDKIDGPSLGEIFKPGAWEKTRSEGTKILQRLLDLQRGRHARSGPGAGTRDRPQPRRQAGALSLPAEADTQPEPAAQDHEGRADRDGTRRHDGR
jgi:hypothetical protein